MKPKDIQDLIDFISKSGLNEVNIETNDFKIAVKRDTDKEYVSAPVAAAATIAAAPVAAAPAPAPASPAAAPAAAEAPSAGNSVEIKSPMIGTFYRKANPESPNFVNVGDTVEVGQVVCIVEAMKLFNEIESEVSGKIVKILVDDNSPIEYDQPLFLVEPA